MGAIRRLLHRLAERERRHTGRSDPLAALAFMVLVVVLYGATTTVFAAFPRGWVGLAIIAAAVLVNGFVLTAFDEM
jgi:fatty acid desaturase